MATPHAILIALSAKRQTLLESEPETLEDVVEARHDEPIPGLLDLNTHWETFDTLLSGRGRDEILGDALLARSGKRFNAGDAMFFDHFNLHRTGFGQNHTQNRYALESWFFAGSTAPRKQQPVVI